MLRQSLDGIIAEEDDSDSNSWHEIDLAKILQPVITIATNRILVGPNLCQNETFLKAFGTFSDLLGLSAVVIGQYIPYFLAPPVGYLASLAVRFHRRKALKYLLPEVQARMNAIQLAAAKKTDPALVDNKPPLPADVIHWAVGTC